MDFNVIKDGELFLLTEKNGDIDGKTEDSYGLFMKDTRFLSEMEILINGEKPTLLSSNNPKSYTAAFYSMIDVKDVGTLELKRERFIYDGTLYEKLQLTNYFLEEKTYQVSIKFAADFQDMFIVRKYREGQLGKHLGQKQDKQGLSFSYVGSDEKKRLTNINWDAEHQLIDEDGTVTFELHMQPGEQKQFTLFIEPIIENETEQSTHLTYEEAFKKLSYQYKQWEENISRVRTDNETFNRLFEQGTNDIKMLLNDIGYGEIPVAGLPWFAVPFGRDSLITSLFMLPLNAKLAKGTIRTLAAYQATEENKWRDEQPGKIMHEIRFGELANTNQIPFNPYYGTIDATPLFLILIAEYYHWTKDIELVKEVSSNIKRALDWIENSADTETGFLAYHQDAEKGFPNQGWKDSSNSIIHKSGEYGQSPIALIEVQGYVYQAKKMLAPIMKELGDSQLADKLEVEANQLKKNINEYFWMDDLQYYAIALDKNNRKVESVTSNTGHLLMADLLDKPKADQVVERLLKEDMYSGYGIRTMSTESKGYNPLSYHNGSVWPHDNGMILLGLARGGYKAEAEQVISGLLDVSRYFENNRLPELFGGHSSELGYPVEYPTTCSPQAWSATTVFTFLQGMLGLHLNGLDRTIQFDPSLPGGMNLLEVDHLAIGEGYVSLRVERVEQELTITIVENTSGYQVVRNK